jgi:hypothetical protein
VAMADAIRCLEYEGVPKVENGHLSGVEDPISDLKNISRR